jgi:hypothetical protein
MIMCTRIYTEWWVLSNRQCRTPDGRMGKRSKLPEMVRDLRPRRNLWVLEWDVAGSIGSGDSTLRGKVNAMVGQVQRRFVASVYAKDVKKMVVMPPEAVIEGKDADGKMQRCGCRNIYLWWMRHELGEAGSEDF